MAIFVTALIVVGYAFWMFSRKGGPSLPQMSTPKNACKWSKTGDRSGAFVAYRCSACGAEAYSRTDVAPQDCKKGLTGGH
jgi:hypothetical protein